ncbi:hypothetical protein, partial [Streptomyces hygroscopicus]|uniref:hypothetical protein n=1 Tax=Streptomyces hygroscopicus TaxID=1912 RepID=UPI00223F3581
MLYVALGPSSRCRNHNRRCANDNGTTPGRSPTRSAGRAPAAPTSRAASPATVGASNTARTDNSTPSTDRTRLINR